MPTYDYTCTNCESRTEVMQKISEAPLKTCAHCGKDSLKRGFGGGIGLNFQGPGFYKTDYAAPSHPESKYNCCPCGKGASCSKPS